MTTLTSNMTLDEKLLDAARMGDAQTIQGLLAAKPATNLRARDPLGNTALMLAAANGHGYEADAERNANAGKATL